MAARRGAAARARRDRRVTSVSGAIRPTKVTYVVDTNPNYTNVCEVDCTFCAFYRRPGHEEAYTHSVEAMLDRFGAAVEQGATTILLQGGVNESLRSTTTSISSGEPASATRR